MTGGESEYIVFRAAPGVPPEQLGRMGGRWEERRVALRSAPGQHTGFAARPTGRFEARVHDDALAEVWEVGPVTFRHSKWVVPISRYDEGDPVIVASVYTDARAGARANGWQLLEGPPERLPLDIGLDRPLALVLTYVFPVGRYEGAPVLALPDSTC